MEADALAETEGGQRWVVEVKWQNKAVGEKELATLARKAEGLQAQPWCISRSGFTAAAREVAAVQGILISSRSDLQKLEKALESG